MLGTEIITRRTNNLRLVLINGPSETRERSKKENTT